MFIESSVDYAVCADDELDALCLRLGDASLSAQHDKADKGSHRSDFLDVWNCWAGTCCHILGQQIRRTWLHGGIT